MSLINVHLDVLELIFARLDGADLVASARVSRNFLAGAIPSLYANIDYTHHHAKRAVHVMSPFATIAAHDHLAVHVKRIAIHAAPLFQSQANQVSPTFLKDLAHALRTATNLRSFICTVKLLPPLLPYLVDKARLRHMRICASLGFRQTALLQDCAGLCSLALDFPSWNVIDTLPSWTASMQKTLVHLTLFMSHDIDASVLNTTLAQLPRLRGLHIIGCPRITHFTVLKSLSHTPDLHELSFSIFPSQEHALPLLHSTLPLITHLSIDIRASYPGLKTLLTRIITRLSPRDALAICGGWIGEIKSSSELADAPHNAGNPPGNPTSGADPGAHNPHTNGPGHGNGHGNDQGDDPPLLSPPNLYHGVTYPNQNTTPPHAGSSPSQPNFFGFSFPFTPDNVNANNNNNDHNDGPGPGPANPPGPIPDLDAPSLISSFPSTLSTLHLPGVSPAALGEIVERCDNLRVLGMVMGNSFSSVKSVRMSSRCKFHTAKAGVRPELTLLAANLSRARALRELILDTSSEDARLGDSDSRVGGSHSASDGGIALLTAAAVRTLMREAPSLRRVVGEGRVWESTTRMHTLPIPFPHCLDIDLALSRARYGPGHGGSHAHGPPGFGSHGAGYSQVEASNNHWFWLTGSESGSEGPHVF